MASGATSSPSRTCRILFLAAPDNAPKKILLSDGVKSQEVELPSMNLSDVYGLAPGNITLKLFSHQPPEGQPIPPDAPSVAIPEAIKDCYLLISSDPKNKVAPLRVQMIDADSGSFKAGKMMWFNLSPFEIGGQLGKTNLSIKSNSRIIVEPPAKGVEDYPVRLGYLPATGKRMEPIFSTLWRHDPAARNVIFILMTANSRMPQVRGFVDSRDSPKSEGVVAKP